MFRLICGITSRRPGAFSDCLDFSYVITATSARISQKNWYLCLQEPLHSHRLKELKGPLCQPTDCCTEHCRVGAHVSWSPCSCISTKSCTARNANQLFPPAPITPGRCSHLLESSQQHRLQELQGPLCHCAFSARNHHSVWVPMPGGALAVATPQRAARSSMLPSPFRMPDHCCVGAYFCWTPCSRIASKSCKVLCAIQPLRHALNTAV